MVDPAERLLRRIEHRGVVGFARDIGGDRDRAAACLLDQRHRLPGPLRIEVGDGDLGPFLREPLSGGPPDPGAAAGYESCLAAKHGHAHETVCPSVIPVAIASSSARLPAMPVSYGMMRSAGIVQSD